MSACPVIVRMYRGLAGDCILVMIGPPGPEHRDARSHILIDCGLLQDAPGGDQRMQAILADIAKVSGDRIDLIVVTHEHADAIAGFQMGASQFAAMEIGRVWFAWTEDPDDPKASAVQDQLAAAHQKLAILQLGQARRDAAPAVSGAVEDLAAGAAKRDSRQTFDEVRGWARRQPGGPDGAERVDYLKPGDVLKTPHRAGAPALTAYVLGPAYDEGSIAKDLPSPGSTKDSYAMLRASADPDTASGRSPFSPRFHWHPPPEHPAGSVADNPRPGPPTRPAFVCTRYDRRRTVCRFASGEAPSGHCCDVDFLCQHRQDYRRLDDILDAARASLALKLEGSTNEASLVIAFELPDTSVMLFAADARVGSWPSWDKLEFRNRDNGDKLEVTARQLLARTRLYKVGHHASHRANLRGHGLDLLTHPGLVALVSTVKAIALKQARKGWRTPNPESYKALIRQTKGRILRGDIKRATVEGDPAPGLAEAIRTLIDTENSRNDANERKLVFDATFAPDAEGDLFVDVPLDC